MREKLNPGRHRLYIPGYRIGLEKARTVGEIVSIMRECLSDVGYNSDMPSHLQEKISRAMKCSESVIETPEVG